MVDVFQTQFDVLRLSAEIKAKSSLGFEIGFGTQQIKIDCQNDIQNNTVFCSELPYSPAQGSLSSMISLSMVGTPELERLVPSNSLDLTGRYLVPWTEFLHIPYNTWSTTYCSCFVPMVLPSRHDICPTLLDDPGWHWAGPGDVWYREGRLGQDVICLPMI